MIDANSLIEIKEETVGEYLKRTEGISLSDNVCDDFTRAVRNYMDSYPEYVGCWEIGGEYSLHVNQIKKPRWTTRLLCKWLLEWKWKDY